MTRICSARVAIDLAFVLGAASVLSCGAGNARESKDSSDETHSTADKASSTSASGGTDVVADTDTDVQACVRQWESCPPCNGGCEGGETYYIWYPSSAGEFQTGSMPSSALLTVAIAQKTCAACDPCGGLLSIKKDDGQWETVSAEVFCRAVMEADRACNDCLTVWNGAAY